MYNKQFIKKNNKVYSPIKRQDKKKRDDVLYLRTTNQKEFMKKNMLNSKVNFKPRNSTAATGLIFKGATEYQGEFLKNKKSYQIKSTQALQDLRNLIFNI